MAVRRSFDIGRWAAALSRPGIDPRVTSTLATVLDVGYDPEHGLFADVQFLPDGDRETCLVGSGYAGNGFGLFVPPKVGDVALVVLPHGSPGYGPVLVSRLWSATDKPPPEFHRAESSDPAEPTAVPTLVVEPGASLRVVLRDGAGMRIELSGTGKLEVQAEAPAEVAVVSTGTITIKGPDVRLGDSASQAIARVGDIVAVTIPPLLVATPGPAGPIPTGQVVIPAPPVLPTSMLGIPAVGQVVSGKGGVKG